MPLPVLLRNIYVTYHKIFQSRNYPRNEKACEKCWALLYDCTRLVTRVQTYNVSSSSKSIVLLHDVRCSYNILLHSTSDTGLYANYSNLGVIFCSIRQFRFKNNVLNWFFTISLRLFSWQVTVNSATIK